MFKTECVQDKPIDIQFQHIRNMILYLLKGHDIWPPNSYYKEEQEVTARYWTFVFQTILDMVDFCVDTRALSEFASQQPDFDGRRKSNLFFKFCEKRLWSILSIRLL